MSLELAADPLHWFPVTGDQCKGNAANPKLIACLQPDRRVDIEVRGSRQVAAGEAPAAAGATAPQPQSPATSGSSAATPGTPK